MSAATTSAEMRLEQIQAAIQPQREKLLGHPLFEQLGSLEALRTFMQHHVFAVWDFMSLLKALQQKFCSTTPPWLPPRDATSARFINEIVLGEESDEDGEGGFASHFDLYLRSMRQCGADTSGISRFLDRLRAGRSVAVGLDEAQVPAAAAQFVKHTFSVIERGEVLEIASAFTFGREDLLPDVFRRIVETLNRQTHDELSDFKYYLDRHIEVDGDQHGPMAARLVSLLCGDEESRWLQVEQAAKEALSARERLLDGILAQVSR